MWEIKDRGWWSMTVTFLAWISETWTEAKPSGGVRHFSGKYVEVTWRCVGFKVAMNDTSPWKLLHLLGMSLPLAWRGR